MLCLVMDMKVDHEEIGIKETHLHPGNPGTNNKEIVVTVMDTAQHLGGQVVVVAVVAVAVVAVAELPTISQILVIVIMVIGNDLRCKRKYG